MRMHRVRWTCECGHEALDYDEVDHECLDADGNVINVYEAQGDELMTDREMYD